ncbi:MAG TPA: hypothetical protein PKC41_10900 [Chitinophagaceae bacterium]|jgi:hypothetical protein|nr:hypothetical protein [Chitinophagaceae bacterium]
MMKFFILYIGVFLISINLFGQIHISNCNQKMLAEHRKAHTYWNSKQQDSLCIIGLDSARKDVANGIIKYYNIGKAPIRAYAISRYIGNTYGIEFESAYCTSESDFFCYNRIMDSVLNSKYDGNFWKKAYDKVDSVQQLGLIDRFVMYKGGEKMRLKDFKMILKKNKVKYKKITGYCMLIIDSTGQVSKIEHISCDPKGLEVRISEVIMQMQNWLPGIEFGKLQTEQTHFEFDIKNDY